MRSDRYSRHRRIPEIGSIGQERISAASVLVVGSGGLGSPALMYLAAAGVGKIGIVDFDVVDLTNLQRQVIFSEAALGLPKAHEAARRVQELNSTVNVEAHNQLLTSSNARAIIAGYDIVIDATDNFATRYLINDACILEGIPCVWASILRFDGQISVFGLDQGPCYRCIFPEPPTPGSVPSCSDAGVLGAMCGVIGSMQAVEALKLIVGVGEPLAGVMGIYDSLSASLSKVPIRRNTLCAVCGDQPSVTELIDYTLWCSASDLSLRQSELEALLAERDAGLIDFALIDIRDSDEVSVGMIPGAIHVPVAEWDDSAVRESFLERDVIVYCKSGDRSGALIRMLTNSGFTRIKHFPGGYVEWSSGN